MQQQRFTFSKNERLCSRATTQCLFSEGKSFVKYPFRITYMPIDSEDKTECKILVSVSKKRFKRAYKRNRIKRLIREAYRLNKHELIDHLNLNQQKIAVAMVYLPTEILNFKDVEKGMKKVIRQLKKETESDEK